MTAATANVGAVRRDAALGDLARRRAGLVLAARRALLVALLENGPATADDVRRAVLLPPGVGAKVFGAVPGQLIRLGIIELDGFMRTMRPEAHARRVQRWRLRDRDAALRWLREHAPPDETKAAPGAGTPAAAVSETHCDSKSNAPPAGMLFDARPRPRNQWHEGRP